MAQTYEPENIASSELFQVRFLIGDTDVTNGMVLEDEEIDWLLTTASSSP
jgi:hypothetical protein